MRSSYGGEGTYDDSLLAEAKRGPWGLLAAGGALGTDGYIQEAPRSAARSTRLATCTARMASSSPNTISGPLRLFVRGSGFNEARGNGTPYQTNGTRLWRYATGARLAKRRTERVSALRLYGSTEHYRQTFSSISNLPDFGDPACSYRCGETPTQFTLVPDNELGAAAHWSQPLGAGLLLVAGADVHDVRVLGPRTDLRQLRRAHQPRTTISATPPPMLKPCGCASAWTLTASGRMDWFQNYDGQQLVWTGSAWMPAATQPPQLDQRIFDPRLGISRKLCESLGGLGFRLSRLSRAHAQRALPLHAGRQQAHPSQRHAAQRARHRLGDRPGHRVAAGAPSAPATSSPRSIAPSSPSPSIRTHRPSCSCAKISARLRAAASPSTSSLHRSAGSRVDGGYQYAHATVTRGAQDLGNWIPEVARNMATLNLRASKPSLGTLSLQSRLSGRQFDDDANDFLLHGYFRLDAYASHDFGKRLQLFAAGENLLNRQIEVAKTPTTTLGAPRVARVGIQLRLTKIGN